MNANLDLVASLLFVFVPVLPLAFWIRSLMRIRLGTAGLLSLAINILVVVAALWLSNHHDSRWNYPQAPLHVLLEHETQSDDAPLLVVAITIAANLAIALSAKLYRAAVLGKVTPEERSPGVLGIRAWLSPVSVISVITTAICAYFSMGYDYVGVTIVGLCVLLVYPLVNIIMQQSPTLAATSDTGIPLKAPADERQRVLALVEAGKITAEDGAELLTALAQSQAVSTRTATILSTPRRIILGGAAIALVGFFLPWFTINVLRAVNDAIASVQSNMPQFPAALYPIRLLALCPVPLACPITRL